MAHWPGGKLIGVRCDILAWYFDWIKVKQRDASGWPTGFRKFLFYGLYHEFKHTLDRELQVSGKQSVLKRSTSLGMEMLDYYKNPAEFWAEWNNILDTFGRIPTEKDVKQLCWLYNRYSDITDRIRIKEKEGTKVTRLDFAIQSPLLMKVVKPGCDNPSKVAKVFRNIEKRNPNRLDERKRKK